MKARYKFLVGGGVIFVVLLLLSIQGLQEMTVFFYTPKEVLAAPADFEDKTIRIGALVEKGSVEWDSEKIYLAFRVTEDSKDFIPVVYHGVKPDMFREGQGVVVEGAMQEDGRFHADTLLVKHSEDYAVDPSKHQDHKAEYYQSLVE